MGIDFEQFCQDNGIITVQDGKNVSLGWVHVNCPFCYDPSFHLGFIQEYNAFKCWICGKHQPKKVLLRLTNNQSWYEIYRKYYNFNGNAPIRRKKRKEVSVVRFPEKFTKMGAMHKKYLRERGFNWRELEQKYNLMGSTNLGRWKYRIIIPVYFNGIPVTFTARDISNKSNIRYKNCPKDFEGKQLKECLYNEQNCHKKRVIAVEGPSDVWRMGDNCVGLFGIEYTKAQVLALSKYEKVFIMFDPEENAQAKADKLASELSLLTDVEIVEIDSDPGDLSKEEALGIKRDLIGL